MKLLDTISMIRESFGGYSRGAFWVDPEGKLHEVEEDDEGGYDHAEHVSPGYRNEFDDPSGEDFDLVQEERQRIKDMHIFEQWVRMEYDSQGCLEIEAGTYPLARRAARLVWSDNITRVYLDLGLGSTRQSYTLEPILYRKFLAGGWSPRDSINLNEATREFETKLIDPALMTIGEYHTYLNPQQKSHSNESYQWDMAKYREWGQSFMAYEKFSTLINAKIVKGERFELRMKTIDNWSENKYVKHDPDGEIIRDEHGMAMYMTPEDLKASPIKQFDYEYCIFNERREPVASAQDEWGCWLFGVALEYRGYGFGPWIGGVARAKIPDRTSGGFTMSGSRNLDKIHEKLVREYLSSGFYSWLVRSGQITKERVQEILKSVNNSMRWNEINRRNGYLDTWTKDGKPINASGGQKKLDLIRVPEPEMDTPDNRDFWGRHLPDHYGAKS